MELFDRHEILMNTGFWKSSPVLCNEHHNQSINDQGNDHVERNNRGCVTVFIVTLEKRLELHRDNKSSRRHEIDHNRDHENLVSHHGREKNEEPRDDQGIASDSYKQQLQNGPQGIQVNFQVVADDEKDHPDDWRSGLAHGIDVKLIIKWTPCQGHKIKKN